MSQLKAAVVSGDRQIQWDVPALTAPTLCEAFQITAHTRPSQVALRTPEGSVALTYAQVADRVRAYAAGLAGLGVRRGETVAIALGSRPDYALLDTAALHLGAVPFAVEGAPQAERLEWILADAGARVVICDRNALETVRRVGRGVEHIVCVDGGGTHSLRELAGARERGFDFECAWRAVQPEDPLTLLYPAQVAGPATQLTHRGMMSQIRGCSALLPTAVGGATLALLPPGEVGSRLLQHYFATHCFGATVTFVAEPAGIMAALASAHPTFLMALPPVYERIRATLQSRGIPDPSALTPPQAEVVRTKIGLGRLEWAGCSQTPAAPKPEPAEPVPNEPVLNEPVLNEPLSGQTVEYFLRLGVPLRQAFEMPEAGGIITCNPLEQARPGTAGIPIAGLELAIAEDGELLVRGPTVMTGYHRDPGRTAEVIDADGWLHTGCRGTLDASDYLSVTGR